MKRRIIYLLLSFLTLLPLQAQLAMGTWKQYPIFGEFTDLIDTGSGIWYVTGGCLYHYDSKVDETRFYEGGKELAGFTVKMIRYYAEKDMLAVAYTDGNIDMILSDGSRVNLPEIKDATTNVEKTINDFVFDGDEMYVATGFGLVIYDLNRFEVKESGIYHSDIKTVIVTPHHILLAPSAHVDWRHKLMIIERGKNINNYSNYREACGYYDLINQAVPLDDSKTLYATIRFNHAGTLEVKDDGTVILYEERTRDYKLSSLSTSDDGTVRFISANGELCHFADRYTIAVDCTLPEAFKRNHYASRAGLSSVWLADEKGIGRYDMSDGGMTVLRDKSVPSDAISFNEVCNIFPTNDGRGFYICNLGSTQTHPLGKGSRYDLRLRADLVERDGISAINPENVSAKIDVSIKNQAEQGKYIFSPICVAESPDDPSVLYIGTGAEGIYVVKDNEEIGKIDGDNSSMEKLIDIYWTVCDIKFDREGNLWFTNATYNQFKSPVHIIPAKALKRGLDKLTADDCLTPDFGRHLRHKDMQLLMCEHSNMIFAKDGDNNHGFVAFNHNGTPTNLRDDSYRIFTTVADQDGKILDPLLWTCMAEDKRGQVWFGTASGVISIPNPNKVMDSDFTINHIKVPRNDGSGLADYLLESDKIVSIAVDNSNRKWIATASSGLFLVSEDGDKIISHFTTSNSPLPTNTITAVYADPMSNSVFVGTLAGLYEYSSSSGPAKEDYSEVYAYPNPVTPDYSGWITIAGLMESSLVKIMDSSMHLVYQTTSEGGTAIWDGCDMGGSRVRSGVYYVLASHQDDSSMASSSKGDVVAKILVVN